MRKTIKQLILMLSTIVMCWFFIFSIDYYKVTQKYEKPLFALGTITSDDGGSGRYQGIGYHYELKGNFMPLQEIEGVTEYKLYLFEHLILDKTKD